MARSEARLAVSIWTDPDFLALSATAQRMFMFLISQPDLAHDGVIALRERRWSKAAAALTADQVAADLAELSAARFVVVDEDAEELLVRSFIRRDKVFRQPNVLRAAQDHLAVVSSRVILAAIGSELRRVVAEEEVGEGSASIIAEMLDTIGKVSPTPTPNPSGNPSDIPTPGTPGERGVVTAVRRDSPNPVPRSPDPVPSGPPPAGQRARGAPRPETRGTRLPTDFAVTDELKTWFAEHCADVDGPAEHAKFVDYWRAQPGTKGRKADWPATWRNWMRKAAENAARAGPTRGTGNSLAIPNGTPRPSTTDQRVGAALALAERLQTAEQEAQR